MPRNRYLFYAALVLFCMAVGSFFLSILPYAQFKSFFDSLMLDRDFESLKEGNALIFRTYIILTGLGVLTFALLLSGKWRLDWKGLKKDSLSLWRFFRPDKDEKFFILTLAGMTLWGAAIRLVNILAPISHDEAYTATVFSPSLFYAMTNYHAPNNQVLHTILVHFSTVFFGFSTWAVRLPAFLAGILIIPAAYWLGKVMYDRYTGLLAAVLIAWWPLQVVYSDNARGYSLVALFALLAFLLGPVVRREKNLVGWLLRLGFHREIGLRRVVAQNALLDGVARVAVEGQAVVAGVALGHGHDGAPRGGLAAVDGEGEGLVWPAVARRDFGGRALQQS